MELHTTARYVRAGDIFVLHGHERTARTDAWHTPSREHVHIEFVGDGDATLPADRPLTVVRRAEEQQTISAPMVVSTDTTVSQ